MQYDIAGMKRFWIRAIRGIGGRERLQQTTCTTDVLLLALSKYLADQSDLCSLPLSRRLPSKRQ